MPVPWTTVSTPLDGQGVRLVRWANLPASDTGVPFVVASYSDKTVQWVGADGTGVTIQGSLDTDPATTDWETLNDPQGNALTAATDRIENILEHPYQIRPSAGAGVTATTIWLLLASTR